MSPARSGHLVRAARVAAGGLLLVVGAVLVPLPGPGSAVIFAGLLLLEREFHWARRLRLRLWEVFQVGPRLLAGMVRWVVDRAAYGLALLPVLVDRFDAGHWPQHPREYATEVVLGLLILVGVHLLYRRGDRFRALAETDALTGLGNRARFRVDLEEAVARGRTTDGPPVLAFIDVDRFKDVNDRLGHEAGDAVLKDVGRALERSIRQGRDRCYRIGGDEFAVLITGADTSGALAALHRGFAQAAPAAGQRVSCSIGIVALAEDAEDAEPDELVRRADTFMYRAKGRDRAPEPRHGLSATRVLGSAPQLRVATAKAGAEATCPGTSP